MNISHEELAVQLCHGIATMAHAGQFRRDGTTPYIQHPEEVGKRGTSLDEIVVGLLHDVLEDSQFTELQLRSVLPDHAVDAVVALTKKDGQTEEEYLKALVACPLAGHVKMHDMASNLADAPTEKQRERYARMAKYLLEHLP